MRTIVVAAAAFLALGAVSFAQTTTQQPHGQMRMQGGMGSGGMMHGNTNQATALSEASKGYMAAMEKMDAPMMQALQASDPDVAFVKGMIPHHQGAIDMAKVALQYGKDEQTRKWATDVVREQEREISEMREWLKKRGVE